MPDCWSFRIHSRSLSCVAVVSVVEGATWFTSSMAPRHWIVAFRKHVFPVLHSPRPDICWGEFVTTFLSDTREGCDSAASSRTEACRVLVSTLLAVPCSGIGLALTLMVGSRRVSISGQEVRAGGEVVGASPGVWFGSGEISKRGLGSVSCSVSFDPVLPRVSCLDRLPGTAISSLALFMLFVSLESVVHSGQVGVG